MNSRERVEQTTHVYSVVISFIIDLCRRGKIRKESAMTEGRRLIEQLFEEELALERKRMTEIAAQLGFDTLTTNTSDHRSSAWFKETGRLFATGEADRCFALAVCHSQIGMGAAHLNTVTLEDTLQTLERFIDQPDPVELERQLSPIKKEKLLGILVSQESLLATIDSTMALAFGEFGTFLIGKQEVPPGTIWVYGAGIKYLTKPEASLVGKHIVSRVPELVLGLEGIRTRGEIKISLNLGTSSGVIYDGQSEPRFYYL